MHWCMEGCSFQPFLKLCFLVKWLIFSQRWNLAFYNEYKNTCHPQIILKLTKVKIFKNSNTLFKRMSALSHFYVFIFPTYASFNLEIAFFSPALSLCLFFQRVNALYFFLSKKKGVFFFFKEAATWTLNKGCCLSMAYFICSRSCHLLWCRHLYGVNFLPLQIFWRLMEYWCLLECFRLQDVIKGFP